MPALRASVLTRVGSAAAVAVLAGGGVMATTTAADAASHHSRLQPTTLSIKNKVVAHGKHHVDVVSGVLRSRHKGVASEAVTLDGRAGKKRRWVAVGTGTTGSDGSVSFTITVTAKSQFKLVFAGDSTHRRSHSNVITVKPVKA